MPFRTIFFRVFCIALSCAIGLGLAQPSAVAEEDKPSAYEAAQERLQIQAHAAMARYREANKRGARKEALQHLNTAVQLKPDYVEAYYERARLYYEVGQMPAALRDASKTIELEPENPGYFNYRGELYYSIDEMDRAKADFDQAIDLDTDFTDAYYNLYLVHLSRKEYDQALKRLDRVVNMLGPSFDLYLNRISLLRDANRYRDAKKTVEEALEQWPGEPVLHYLLGYLHNETFEFTQALGPLQYADELEPADPLVRRELAMAMARNGFTDPATRLIAHTIADNPGDARAYSVYTLIHIHLEDYAAAHQYIDKAILMAPTDGSYHAMKARVSLNEGKAHTALKHANRAVALSPDKFEPYFVRTHCYIQLDQQVKALADIEKAVKFSDRAFITVMTRAELFMATGQWDRAQTDLEAALKESPGNPAIRYKMGGIALARGDVDAAMQNTTLSIFADNENPLAYILRAECWIKKQDYTSALRDLDQALRLEPDNTKALSWRIRVNVMQNPNADVTPQIDRLLAKAPDDYRANDLAADYFEGIQQYDRALIHATKCAQAVPNSALDQGRVGRLLMTMGRFRDSIPYSSRAIQLAGEETQFWFQRGAAYHEIEQYELAAIDIREASRRSPDDIKINSLLGINEIARGRQETGTRVFDRLTSQHPTNPQVWSNRGVAMIKLNRLDQALEDFQHAIDLDPSFVFAYEQRASIYYNRKEPAHAIDEMTRLINQAPQYPRAYLKRGVLHAEMGRYELALTDVETCRKLGGQVPPGMIKELRARTQ